MVLDFIKDWNFFFFFFCDYNLDFLKINYPGVLDFMNIMHSHACCSLTTKPTRVADNSATIIDRIWTSSLQNSIDNCIIYTDVTDHFPVYFRFKKDNVHNHQRYIDKRILSEENINVFKWEIANIKWRQSIDMRLNRGFWQVSHRVHCYISKVLSHSENYAHLGFRNSVREKRMLEIWASKGPLTFRQTYKIYRKKLVTLLRDPKNMCHQDQLKSPQGNIKTIWKIIKQLLKRRNCHDDRK